MKIAVNEPTIKNHKIELEFSIDELYNPRAHITTQRLVVRCSTFTEDTAIYDKIENYLHCLQSKIDNDIKNLY